MNILSDNKASQVVVTTYFIREIEQNIIHPFLFFQDLQVTV